MRTIIICAVLLALMGSAPAGASDESANYFCRAVETSQTSAKTWTNF
jgi:hypothetical protein